MINFDEMRERVTVAQRGTAQSATYGEHTTSGAPTSYGTFWAKIRASSGDEKLVADRLQGEVTYVVTMRYTTVVTPKRYLYWISKALVLYVVSAIADEMRTTLTVTCKQGVI